uniref:DNA circularization N-terminal domain-containing protein n=1 Tax=Neisseria basseii TaxID=2830650 RepID=UPI00357103BC
MWHTVLQPASFKGAAFDVENVEERNGRVLAEHARPFADGTDLEDMGTSGREVRISAVFWGKGYAVRLKNLLDKLEERGAGVLVHPVWGRMTDMAAAEWSYRHEADYADFARIDMTFREAAEPQEIFVFENHFLMEIERLIVQTDALRAAAEGFIDALAAEAEARGALFGSAAALRSVLAGSLAAVRRLPGWDAVRFRPRVDDDGKTFAAAFAEAAAAVLEEFGESAAVPDLMLLNREVRRRVQTALAAVRALPSEGMRDAVFGAEEILRLNPHIAHPSFVARGVWLNLYAQGLLDSGH